MRQIQNDPWIIGMDPVEQACRTMEATIHERGWDQPTTFMTLSLVGDYKTADLEELMMRRTPGGLLVQEITLPEFVHADPAEGLSTFLTLIGEDYSGGDEQRRKDITMILNRLIPMNFFGFGIIYEAWQVESDSREEIEQVAEERSAHLHPNRVELRGLLVATRDGRLVCLGRKRGQFPEYWEMDPTDSNVVQEGRLLDGIRLITTFFANFDEWRRGAVERPKHQKPS